jgi:hypothetical protein
LNIHQDEAFKTAIQALEVSAAAAEERRRLTEVSFSCPSAVFKTVINYVYRQIECKTKLSDAAAAGAVAAREHRELVFPIDLF